MVGLGFMRHRLLPVVAPLLSAFVLLSLAHSAAAQQPALSFASELGLEESAPSVDKLIRFSAEYKLEQNGRNGLLMLTADIDKNHHIYSITQPPKGPLKSTIKIKTKEVEQTGDIVVHPAPKVSHKPDIWPDIPIEEHHGKVTWYIPIRLAANADPEELPVTVSFFGQICTNETGNCQLVDNAGAIPAKFAGFAPAAELVPPKDATAKPNQASPARPSTSLAAVSLSEILKYLGMGFLGGVILNLMPCVLPVVGIKILSFVKQAGESRSRVLGLNLWFSLGLLSVFWILAALAITLNLGWGEQFTHTWFKVALTALVFSMALSFLGVWEIPIPGFVGTGASNELQMREGYSGAFFKGVFTTLLATPCSGPLLGAAFGWSLKQTPIVSLLLFTSIGLGMASPYLAIGAFPGLIRFLPKPGLWMETFKQAMAFFLLGTVIYLFTTISSDYFIATLTLLFGIWFACWLIGRIPVTAELRQKAVGWLAGSFSAAAVGLIAFTLLTPQKELIPWQPFSPAALAQARAEGKTVLVEFTADWCLTCKYNLKFAINTVDVQRRIQENDVVPLLADWTDPNEEIRQALLELNSNSIPLLAVYPPDPDAEPIVLRDLIAKNQVLGALDAAGPSKTVAASKNPERIRTVSIRN